ncbi:MAG: pyrimidine 5'-nucleotidase [Anaerolineae bacterium]
MNAHIRIIMPAPVQKGIITDMRFTTIFFDLDDTLYPASTGLWEVLKARMGRYMAERLDIPESEIARLREQYFREYGTTLRGLQANYHVDPQDFLAYVHDVPLHDYLTPNPALGALIASLPTRNLIFTNADLPHARRVLAVLGLEGCFSDIVDINAIAPYCKPMPEAFHIAMKIAGEEDAHRCVIIDDQPRTTRTARSLGMLSILYGQNEPHPDADFTLTDWQILPALLNGRKP